MTLTKSKKICSLLAACCAVAVFAGLAAFVPSVSADAKTESDWSVVKQEGDAVWNVQDDGSVSTLRDSDYDKNFLVCDSDQAYGDYKVSAHFQVSENLAEANGSEIKLGLVPWYLDENNYRRTYIAVEKNGEILPKSEYDTTYLNDGDKIEIVSFVGGG